MGWKRMAEKLVRVDDRSTRIEDSDLEKICEITGLSYKVATEKALKYGWNNLKEVYGFARPRRV